MVNAWLADNSLVLGQLSVDEQSNEITAIPELLEMLELAGCIVTIGVDPVRWTVVCLAKKRRTCQERDYHSR